MRTYAACSFAMFTQSQRRLSRFAVRQTVAGHGNSLRGWKCSRLICGLVASVVGCGLLDFDNASAFVLGGCF